MTISVQEQSNQRRYALTAGIFLIIMTLAAFFSYGFVHASLVVKGDATATYNNIMAAPSLFKAEIFGWIMILISDIVVAWAFYIFLKPIHKNLSLLGAWLRLIYTTILGIAVLNLIFVLLLTKNTADPLQTQVMLFLEAFKHIWSVGLIIFGGHLMIISYLAFRSKRIPKVISVLLLLASIGYIVIHTCNIFIPEYDGVISILTFVFTVPMIAGELGFGIWLLLKGGKIHKSQ